MFGIKTGLIRLSRRIWREVLSPDPRDAMIPPPELIYIGLGDFKEVGEKHLGYFVDDCGLEPHHRVLDVGCGVGRIAVPLTQHLSSSGSYVGFDIVESAIEWCRGAITTRHPNFRFDHFDVYNGGYNTTATQQAAGFRFPYASGEFDFVCAVSVFTHLLYDDARSYLAEIGRVLRPGGALYASIYLYDDDAAGLIARGRTSLPFQHRRGPTLVVKPEEPEYATAYEPQVLRQLFERAGLEIAEPIRQGRWRRGGDAGKDYQDVAIALKPQPEPAAAAPPRAVSHA